MTLLKLVEVPEHQVETTIRHRGLPWLVFLLVWAPIAPLIACQIWMRVPHHWLFWMLGTLIGVPSLLVWLVVVFMAWTGVIAAFRWTNWLMKVTPLGIYLRFRSYQNYHFPEDGPTIVYFAFSEIARARKYRWRTTIDEGQDQYHHQRSYLELVLHDKGTEPLRAAIALEQSRQAPQRWVSWRSNHVPVVVAEPGVVQVEWLGRRMMQAMKGRVDIVMSRRSGTGRFPNDNDTPIDDLVRRGARLEAIKESRRRFGMSHVEARRHVEEIVHKQVTS